ncbi:MAG TPA: DUF4157 domain-containing protein [Pyrinomonadaceae bacterium]|jgi:hypothetical protein
MLLAAESHRHLEEFHRHFEGDERLRLPPVYLYKGRVSRWLTHTFNIAAITFGRRIFVKPELIRQNQEGKWTAPAWLIAHETAHVLQYEEAGFVRFLISYLSDYWRSLGGWKIWNPAARLEAYRAIKVEREAREAEAAYAAWAEKQGGIPKTEG